MKKFTQAYSLYEGLHQRGLSTPAMYLRMAYIKEGLGDIANAMYFLNQYYYLTFNKMALKKMEMLAEENRLAGYEYEDLQFFLNLVLKNGLWVQVFLLSICLLLLSSLIYRRLKTRASGRGTAVALTFFVSLFIVYNNFQLIPDYAIIKNEQVFLMGYPSAGSDAISTIKKGNKLRVVRTDDAWVKVEYNDQTGYVRDNNLLMIKSEQFF